MLQLMTPITNKQQIKRFDIIVLDTRWRLSCKSATLLFFCSQRFSLFSFSFSHSHVLFPLSLSSFYITLRSSSASCHDRPCIIPPFRCHVLSDPQPIPPLLCTCAFSKEQAVSHAVGNSQPLSSSPRQLGFTTQVPGIKSRQYLCDTHVPAVQLY